MRRLGPGLVLALVGAAAWAQDPAELQARYEAKVTEIESLESAAASRARAAEGLAAEVERLEAASAGLAAARARALETMNGQYQRIVEDPTLELTEARIAYGEALAAERDHLGAIAGKQEALAVERRRLEQALAEVESAREGLAGLRRDYDLARVDRLRRELTGRERVTVTNTITCTGDETIAGCIERGEREAREAARLAFLDRLFAAATDAEAVLARRDAVDIATEVADARVERSGFRGQGEYFVDLSARVGSRVERGQACRLLGLDEAACGTAAATVARPDAPAAAPDAADAAGPYLLTVRSNVYYDEVFIDGVAYGSTRVDVMLPAGDYLVEVRKPGYDSYREQVRLDAAATVKAELAEQ